MISVGVMCGVLFWFYFVLFDLFLYFNIIIIINTNLSSVLKFLKKFLNILYGFNID